VLAALLDHWAARLAGPGAAGELLTDRPRPVVSTYEGGVERFAMPGDVVDGLRALGRPHGATLYMGLLAVLKVVLARWTGSDDVVVGGTTAGRNRTALDDVVGLFVNPLALRTDLSGDPPFAEVVSRVRRTVLDALDHQDAPFDRVVARVKPPRDLSRNPLFQVAFELWEGDAGPSDVGGVTWTDVGGPSGAEYGAVDGGAVAARLDVELFVRSAAEGSLDASLVYATDLFGPATMARFAAHYRRVLDAVVADPALRLSELPLP
jgi:non-ribosomal peptide synthetase component F